MSRSNRNVCKAVRNDRTVAQSLNIKLDAWLKGKNPMLTTETGLKKEGFKRVPARSILGDPRTGWFFSSNSKEGSFT